MKEPRWLRKDAVLAIHREQILLTGGSNGIRDDGLLDSALSRPRNQWAYTQAALPDLGAAYAIGVCRNHPFIDGNKRTAFLAMYTFLVLNGHSLEASDAEATAAMLDLAAGPLSDEMFVAWVRDHSTIA